MKCPIPGCSTPFACNHRSTGGGWWREGDVIDRWDVCAVTPISTGIECGGLPVRHFWVERSAGEVSLILVCAEHVDGWRAMFGADLQREHGYRERGSACGIEGTEWHVEGNICLPGPAGTDEALWAALAIEASA